MNSSNKKVGNQPQPAVGPFPKPVEGKGTTAVPALSLRQKEEMRKAGLAKQAQTQPATQDTQPQEKFKVDLGRIY